MLTLTKISETASKITLGWTPVPGAIGYRFQTSTSAPRWSHTWDATRSQVTFSKADWYKVEALGVEQAGEYPSADPPPPDPTDTYQVFADLPNGPWDNYFFLQRFQGKTWTGRNETGTPWPDGSGIFNPSPGVFRFVNKGSVPVGSGNGIQIASKFGTAVVHQSGKVCFPQAGNPAGFQTYSGDWNALGELVDGSHEIYNQWGVDATQGAPTIYVRTYKSQDVIQKFRAPTPTQFYDVDHTWRWEVKLSKGSDGYARFWFNGAQVMNYTGITADGAWNIPGWLQWGWYGDSPQHRNEVLYAEFRVGS